MTRTTSIGDTVRAALDGYGVPADARVAVACSGGPDSVALAHACMSLCAAGRLGPVTLVYVDHGLRDGTGDEAALVRALAERHGGSSAVLTATVDRERASLEDAARDARYAVIERWCETSGLDWVLLAHTASDQAETVLMRIMRGTGVVGLAGIPGRRGRYVRPMLALTRRHIEEYLADRGLDAVVDPMNEDPGFFRVRVRRSLLPLLRAENPNVDQALCRLAGSAREQREILDFAAERLLAQARCDGGRIGWPVETLQSAPAAVAKRAVYLASQSVGMAPLDAKHLSLVAEMAARATAGTRSLDLPGGRASRVYDELWVEPAARRDVTNVRQVVVVGPNPPYAERRWQPGDRMCPERLKGRSRKLSDLFADAKVPAERRSTAVVVVREQDGEIVWVEGVGRAWESGVDVSLTTPHAMASNKD